MHARVLIFLLLLLTAACKPRQQISGLLADDGQSQLTSEPASIIARVLAEATVREHRKPPQKPFGTNDFIRPALGRRGVATSGEGNPFDVFELRYLDEYVLGIPDLSKNEQLLAAILGISADEALAVMAFYNFEVPPIDFGTLEGYRVFQRLVLLAREADPIYQFYQQHLTQLSVPEMRERLSRIFHARYGNHSESMIYTDIWEHGLSLREAWRQELGASRWADLQVFCGQRSLTLPTFLNAASQLIVTVRFLHDSGVDNTQVAAILKVGEEPLTDAKHHFGIEPKGERWTGSQELFLALHYGEPDWPMRRLQLELLSLGRSDPREGAIRSKAAEMGLTDEAPAVDTTPVDIPGIGRVKENGFLIDHTLEAFLLTNPEATAVELARTLRVSERTIGRWRKRLGLVAAQGLSELERQQLEQGRQSLFDEAGLARHQRQEGYIRRAVEHYQETGELVTSENCVRILGIRSDNLVGTGATKALQIFDSPYLYWMAFDGYVRVQLQKYKQRGLESEEGKLDRLEAFDLFEITVPRFEHPSRQTYLSLLDQRRGAHQSKVIESGLEFARQHGRFPKPSELASLTGFLKSKIVGTGSYKPGATSHRKRIFDSPVALYQALINARDAASSRAGGVDLQRVNLFLSKLHWQDLDEADVKKRDTLYALERPGYQGIILSDMLNSNKQSKIINVGKLLRSLGYNVSAVLRSSKAYHAGGDLEHRGVFDGAEDLKLRYARYYWEELAQQETNRAAGILSQEEATELAGLKANRPDFVPDRSDLAAETTPKPPKLDAEAGSREEKQQIFVQKAVEHLRDTGELVTSLISQRVLTISWNKLVGAGSYSGSSFAVFDSPYLYWMAFDGLVKEQLARPGLEESNLEKEQEERLAAFDIFEMAVLRFDHPSRRQFLALLEQRRQKRQGKVVEVGLDFMQREGRFPGLEELARLSDYKDNQQLTGLGRFAKGKVSHDKRIFDSRIALYQSLLDAKNRKLSKGQASSGKLVRANLLSSQLKWLDLGESERKELNALYDQDRPGYRSIILADLLLLNMSQKIILTSALQSLGYNTQQALRAGSAYKPGGSQGHLGGFDGAAALQPRYAEYYWEQVVELENRQADGQLSANQIGKLAALKANRPDFVPETPDSIGARRAQVEGAGAAVPCFDLRDSTTAL